jgi:hypothetical protein
MKYITATQPLEAQVGGVFHSLTPGSHNVEDAVADFLVSNYADRGVSFGVKPSEDGEVVEAAEPGEPAPSALSRDTADVADDAAEEPADDRSRRNKRTK